MALTVPYDAAGLDGKLRNVIDSIVAAIQTWAGKVDGINAAERLNELSTGIASLPTFDAGDIIATGRSTARNGFLMCDGSAVSRTTYANLFAAITTTYGSGDGSTTFNVPNLQQRFPLGKASSGTGSTLGSTGGAIDHTHTGPSHTHTGPSHTHSISASGTHTHSMTGVLDTFIMYFTGTNVDNNGDGSVIGAATGIGISSGPTTVPAQIGHTHTLGTLATAADGDHSHGGTTGSGGTGNTGASGTGNTGTANPPYQVVNYMIKT